MSSDLRVTLAQRNPTVGDIDANVGDADGPASSEASFKGTLGGSLGGDGAGTNGFAWVVPADGLVGLDTVHYTLAGNVLTATITASSDATRIGHALFTATITNPATGAYTVTLLDNVLNAGGPNNEATNATAAIERLLALRLSAWRGLGLL